MHPAHPTNALHTESLFGLLSRHSTFVAASAEDLGELVRRAFGVVNPLLAQVALRPSEVRPAVETDLIEALDRCNLEGLDALTCTPYMTREEAAHHVHSPMLATTLRYCPRCLQLGFHSMFYQHLAVTNCPYHGIPLLNQCHYCERPWKPTIKSIVDEPFCCPSCRWLHWKTVLPPGGTEELNAASWAILPRCHDLEARRRIPHERVSVFALTHGLNPARETSSDRRRWHRIAAWPEQLTPYWQRFREEAFHIGMDNWPREGEFRMRDWQDLSADPTATLRWLVQECQAPADQCRRLLEGAWQRIQNITPLYQDRQLGAVATALHLTLARYGWLQINLRALDQGWQQYFPHRDVRWNGAHSESTPRCFGESSGHLIAAEILGYFALNLLRCAGLHALTEPGEEFGQMHLTPVDYCPSWFVHRDGHVGWELRIRGRASRKLVQRLIRRYRDRTLQRMVVSTWPSSPAIPDVARLGDLDCAPELAQFPRRIGTEAAHGAAAGAQSAWAALREQRKKRQT